MRLQVDPNRSLRKQDFAVIGLGRFGASLARSLMKCGSTVLGIDHDGDLVQRYADDLTQTVQLDSTDEAALHEIDIVTFPTVIVAIGAHFEASLLTVVNLKQLGVSNIVVKAATRVHRDILKRVGADRVLLPEEEAGLRLGRELASSQVVGEMRLDERHVLRHTHVAPEWVGKRLIDIESDPQRRRECLLLVGARGVIVRPSPNLEIAKGDQLVVVDETQNPDAPGELP